MGVRRGTEVWGIGGRGDPSPTLPASGEGANHTREHRPGHDDAASRVGAPGGLLTCRPRPAAGAAGTVFSPSLAGGPGGAEELQGVTLTLLPIETLLPGDFVLAHDGQPHRILRVIRYPYRGPMKGLHLDNPSATVWITADQLVLAKPRPRTLGGQRDWSAVPLAHVQRGRELRRGATPPERSLWTVLRRGQLGYKFRRQHPIGPYIADFYSREAHLIVEVDGASHFEPQAQAYDAQRTAYLRALGLQVIRFKAREIATNLDGVCQAIWHECHTRTESIQGAQWVPAGEVLAGDLVCCGLGNRLAEVTSADTVYSDGEGVLDLASPTALSFLTLVCAIHPWGAGRGS